MMKYKRGFVSILKRSVTGKRATAAVMTLLICLFANVLWAESRWTPQLNLSAVQDDNIRFSRTDTEDDYVYHIEPGISYEYDQEVTSFSANGSALVRRYQDNTELDDEVYRFWLDGNSRVTERFNMAGRYELISDTTLDSELEEIGRFTETTEQQTAPPREYRREERLSHNATVSPNFNISERLNAGLSLNYRDVTYDSEEFVDYISWDVGVPIRWRLATQIDSVYISPGYNRRESDANESDTYKFRIGWDHDATERLTVNSEIGVRYTEITDAATGDSVNNWNGLGNIDFTYTYERGRLNLLLEHDLRNSADGEQVNVSRVILDLLLNFTERSGVNLDVRYIYSQNELDEEENDESSEFFEVGAELFYKITINHDAYISYRYSQDEPDDAVSDSRAERNRIWAGVRLNFPI